MDEPPGVVTEEEMEELRYPIGRFRPRSSLSAPERDALIDDIEALPADLRAVVSDLLRSLAEERWARRFRHPELGILDLETNLQIYAWHGRHHLAHIERLRERSGW